MYLSVCLVATGGLEMQVQGPPWLAVLGLVCMCWLAHTFPAPVGRHRGPCELNCRDEYKPVCIDETVEMDLCYALCRKEAFVPGVCPST